MLYLQLRYLYFFSITIILSCIIVGCSGRENNINNLTQDFYKKCISSTNKHLSELIINIDRNILINIDADRAGIRLQATNRNYLGRHRIAGFTNFNYDDFFTSSDIFDMQAEIISSILVYQSDDDLNDIYAFIGLQPNGNYVLRAAAYTVDSGRINLTFGGAITLPGQLTNLAANTANPNSILVAFQAETNRIYLVNIGQTPELTMTYQIPDDEEFVNLYYDEKLKKFVLVLRKKKKNPDDPDQVITLYSEDGSNWSPEDTDNLSIGGDTEEGLAAGAVGGGDEEGARSFFALWPTNGAASSTSTTINFCPMGGIIRLCYPSLLPTSDPIVNIKSNYASNLDSTHLTVNPTILAGDEAGKIMKTTDMGRTWIVAADLAKVANVTQLQSLGYDPGNQIWYAAVITKSSIQENISYNSKILASPDGIYWINTDINRFGSLATTGDSYCAIENDPSYPNTTGQILCWGNNDHNKLGLGPNPISTPTPTQALIPARIGIAADVPGPISYQSLAGGDLHMCALRTSGNNKIDCWGDGELGQLGDGIIHGPDYSTPVPTPVNMSGIKSVDKLVAGGSHSCILSEGKISCWGSNNEREINGLSSQTIFPIPSKASFNDPFSYTDLAAGSDFTCAMDVTQINCWGNHYNLPYQSMTISDTQFSQFTSISAGGQTACVLSSQMHDKGTNAWCWGDNTYGQVGNNSSGTFISAPQKVVSTGGGLRFINISQSAANTCGLTDKGLVYCWGDNSYKQTGLPDLGLVLNPEAPISLNDNPGNFSKVTTGLFSTCVISNEINESGNITHNTYCFGNNRYGQLGIGSVTLKESDIFVVNRSAITPKIKK